MSVRTIPAVEKNHNGRLNDLEREKEEKWKKIAGSRMEKKDENEGNWEKYQNQEESKRRIGDEMGREDVMSNPES